MKAGRMKGGEGKNDGVSPCVPLRSCSSDAESQTPKWLIFHRTQGLNFESLRKD